MALSHGVVEGLAQRVDRLAVVWIDAHGDLNTPESSPSGKTGSPSTTSSGCSAGSPAALPVAGAGFTGLVRDRANEPLLERFAVALGL